MTRFVAFCLGACLAGAAPAQSSSLADPTRPPQVSAGAAESSAAPEGPRLQSVLISPTRRAAVIDGRSVSPGAKFGDATVESISENTVVLRHAGRTQTLHLIPGLDKRERRIAAGAPPMPADSKKGRP